MEKSNVTPLVPKDTNKDDGSHISSLSQEKLFLNLIDMLLVKTKLKEPLLLH